jgi:hypothetical protein
MKPTLRLAFAFAVALLAGTPTGAAPVPKDAGGSGSEYYPLTVGNKWVYKIGDQEATVRVAGIERIDKEDCFRVETEIASGVKVSEVYAKRTDGIYRVKVKDDILKNPVKILPTPAKLDASWKINSALGGQTVTGTMTVKGVAEKVKTPAGEFVAVLVESSDADIGGMKVQLRFWYAKGVGLVKQEIALGGLDPITLELSKFTPGEAPAPKP